MKEDESQAVHDYWLSFIATLSDTARVGYHGYSTTIFGDTAELVEQLTGLIISGKKTATCSALWEYEADDDPVPRVGDVCIVVDIEKQPRCIIETTEVAILAFGEVDASHAAAEGEGDLSLQYWRAAHNEFFTRSLARIGKEPSGEMPLVCERIHLLYSR